MGPQRQKAFGDQISHINFDMRVYAHDRSDGRQSSGLLSIKLWS